MQCEDLAGTSREASYDGSNSGENITDDVQSLCNGEAAIGRVTPYYRAKWHRPSASIADQLPKPPSRDYLDHAKALPIPSVVNRRPEPTQPAGPKIRSLPLSGGLGLTPFPPIPFVYHAQSPAWEL